MWKYRFPLSSGRVVELASLTIRDTSLDIGRAEFEAKIIEYARKYALHLWMPPRAIHVIPPIHLTETLPGSRETLVTLPPICYTANLVCHEDFKDDVMSELIVIWFDRADPDRGVLEIVSQACKGVPWDDLARPCSP